MTLFHHMFQSDISCNNNLGTDPIGIFGGGGSLEDDSKLNFKLLWEVKVKDFNYTFDNSETAFPNILIIQINFPSFSDIMKHFFPSRVTKLIFLHLRGREFTWFLPWSLPCLVLIPASPYYRHTSSFVTIPLCFLKCKSGLHTYVECQVTRFSVVSQTQLLDINVWGLKSLYRYLKYLYVRYSYVQVPSLFHIKHIYSLLWPNYRASLL